MKVSAAIQILTTVMSGTDDWSSASPSLQQPGGDFTPRGLDLDLGACLDVETLGDFSHNMYNDADTQLHDDNAWVEDNGVLDMTSSSELTSSGEHGAAGIVPSLGGFSLGQNDMSAAPDNFGFVDGLTVTDNATFLSLEALGANVGGGDSIMEDLAQFSCLSSTALTSTTATSTIDLTALEQFVTMDVDNASKPSAPMNASNPCNIPSSLWNLDLTLPTQEDDGPSTSRAAGVGQDVKETLKNRLYSRGSLNSVSQDSDVNGCSSRSLSSPTSSVTQSFDEDDADDPVKALEKREKNRVAAQKCRNKKREKAETLQKVTVCPNPDGPC